MERKLNGFILGLFIVLFFLCVLGSLGNFILMNSPKMTGAW